ncbi:MAG TPA: T9SS type A sorting domain-containing protein [Bacteroidia bacterium]|jgi:hypothetical protein|nr:T9SS type A sorting domain-containing protein [Bacteroidia bacterium]
MDTKSIFYQNNGKSINKFLVLLSLCLLINTVNAQRQYSYDANGNRILRISIGPPIVKHKRTNTNSLQSDSLTAVHYGLTVYPNPSRYEVSVNITNLDSAKMATIYFISESGSVLFSKQVTTVPVPIDISKFATGIYFVKVVINKEQLFYRVIKN